MKVLIAADWREINEYEYYIMALKDLGIRDVFLSLDPEKAKDADGIVIPGSKCDVNPALWGEAPQGAVYIDDHLDQAQWAIMDLAVALGIPVIGMCRGIQFINVYYGGSLIQHLASADAHKPFNPDRYHKIHNVPGSFMHTLYGPEVLVNSRHHQAVGRIGTGLQAVSLWHCDKNSNRNATENWEKEVVDVLVHQVHNVIGLQWHPEKMMYLGDEKNRKTGKIMMTYFIHRVENYHLNKKAIN